MPTPPDSRPLTLTHAHSHRLSPTHSDSRPLMPTHTDTWRLTLNHADSYRLTDSRPPTPTHTNSRPFTLTHTNSLPLTPTVPLTAFDCVTRTRQSALISTATELIVWCREIRIAMLREMERGECNSNLTGRNIPSKNLPTISQGYCWFCVVFHQVVDVHVLA